MWEGLLAGPLPLCLRDSSLVVRSVALDVMATIGDDTLKQQNVRAITLYMIIHSYPDTCVIDFVSLLLSIITISVVIFLCYKSVVFSVVSPRLMFSKQNHYRSYCLLTIGNCPPNHLVWLSSCYHFTTCLSCDHVLLTFSEDPYE